MSIVDIDEELEQIKNNATTEEYAVSPDERHLYHVLLLKGNRYNPKTGAELAKPFIQKFAVKDFKNFQAYAAQLGYTEVTILFDPTKQ